MPGIYTIHYGIMGKCGESISEQPMQTNIVESDFAAIITREGVIIKWKGADLVGTIRNNNMPRKFSGEIWMRSAYLKNHSYGTEFGA